MDYEKKYNEALERAQKAIRAGGDVAMEIVQHIFPELRESEDERIRKWLIDYFSSIKETVWIHRDITCKQILAYLEKQKEPSWKPGEEQMRDLEEAADNFANQDCARFTPRFNGFIAGAKWQKEQMLKEAVEGEIQMRYSGSLCDKTIRAINEDKFKFGDKVRIIIVKEDEK